MHWAAERNFIYLMYFLLKNGAEIEAKDMAGRTPLFLAVKNGTRETIDAIKVRKKWFLFDLILNKLIKKLLLAYGANPYAFSYGKKFAINYTSDNVIKNLIKESQKVIFWLKNSLFLLDF